MAEHSNFGGALRPDQQRYAHMMGGIVSPLWVPFMAAASVGAAWWVVQNWPRMAGGANLRSGADGAPASANGAGAPAQALKAAPSSDALAQTARSFSQEVAAPVTQSVAVQGANDSEAAPTAPAAAPRKAPAPRAQAASAAETATPAPRKAKAPRKAAGSGEDPAVSKLLAAASAHPEPELPPHEGLPARKKGGGKGKKNGG